MASNSRSKILQNSWTGGIAQGSKTGYINSFQDGVGIDYQTDPDYITALPALKKDSGSNVTDLVKWILTDGTNDYMYGDAGKIYKRDSGGSYSTLKTVSSSHGNGIELFNNELFYASDSSIGKTTGGIVTFNDDYFVTASKEAPDVANDYHGSANTYTLATSIGEGATAKYTFVPTVTLFTGITIQVIARGTGNWNVTLHDNSNNVVSSNVILNASLPSSATVCRILFSGATITAGNSYHIHITSSVADGTVRTLTSSDFSTAEIAILTVLTDFDVDQSKLVGSSLITALPTSYTVTTSMSETATDKLLFTPTVSTLKAISLLFSINVANPGTVTIAVHDSNNKSIGTASITDGRARGTWVKFVFSSALTLIPGANYHIHINYANSGTAPTIMTSVASDFSTAYFKTYFQALQTDTNYHMGKVFSNLLCFGNGQFLLTIDDSEVLKPEALTFPLGESVRCIETIGDYLAISTWRGTLDDGKSRIYFWDGTSPTFNSFVDIDGVTNSMKNDGTNQLFVLHGTQINMSVYTGAITKVRRLKYVQNAIKSYVAPGAIDTLEGLIYFGNNSTTNSVIDTLLYSYGHKDKDFPMGLNKNFPISSGNKGTTVTIGAILGKSADHFLVSWKDTTSGTVYGVDILDTNPQLSVNFTTLRFDRGYPELQKHGHDVSVRCSPIVAGQKITIEYRLNNITSGGNNGFGTLGTIGDTNAGNNVDAGIHYRNFNLDKLFFEIEFKVTLATTVAAPIFYQLAINDELEGNFRIDDQIT